MTLRILMMLPDRAPLWARLRLSGRVDVLATESSEPVEIDVVGLEGPVGDLRPGTFVRLAVFATLPSDLDDYDAVVSFGETAAVDAAQRGDRPLLFEVADSPSPDELVRLRRLPGNTAGVIASDDANGRIVRRFTPAGIRVLIIPSSGATQVPDVDFSPCQETSYGRAVAIARRLRRRGHTYEAELPTWALLGRASFSDSADLILDAAHRCRPLSLIRLGDGEGPVMHRPDAKDGEVRRSFTTWFGKPPEVRDLDMLHRLLRLACATADVLGVPSEFQIARTERFRRVFYALDAWNLPTPRQMLTDAFVNWYMQFSGFFSELLYRRDEVGIIGCRDLVGPLQERFHIARVDWYRTPGERTNPGAVETDRHWPDVFHRIEGELAVAPGMIFLVGAGLLGKHYCARIKELGGIALDVGSLLDGWAGVPSRARLEMYPEAFDLEHAAMRFSDRDEKLFDALDAVAIAPSIPRSSD